MAKNGKEYVELVQQAERAVAAIGDPELKRIAFQKILDDLRVSLSASMLDSVSKVVQVLTIVVGVVVSVLSFNATRQSEARARTAEIDQRKLESQKYADQRSDEAATRQREAAKPFLELR